MTVGVAVDDIFVRLDADIRFYQAELRKAVRSTSTASKKISKEIEKAGASFQRMERAVKGAGVAAKLVGVAIAAAFGGAAVRAVYQAGTAFDAVKRTLKTVAGSLAEGRKEFAFVSAEAHRLGLNLLSTAGNYANLAAASKGTKLEGQATRDIFTAVSESMAVLGKSSYDTAGALKAIEQMMSKGNVQAEELRGQLGERLPGAFQLAARAMGVSTMKLNDMLEAGKVMAEDLLPKLAIELRKTFGAGVTEAMASTRAEVERMATAWLKLKNSMFENGGSGIFANAARNIASIADRAREAVEWIGKLSNSYNKDYDKVSAIVSGSNLKEALAERDKLIKDIEKLQGRTDVKESVKKSSIAVWTEQLKTAQQEVTELQRRFANLTGMTGRSADTYTRPAPVTKSASAEVLAPGAPKPRQKPEGIAIGYQSFDAYEDGLEKLQQIVEKAKEKFNAAKEDAKSVLAVQREAFLQATMSEAEYLAHQQEQQLAAYKGYLDKKLITDADYERAKRDLEGEFQKKRDELRDEELKKEKAKIDVIKRNSQQLARDLIDGWEGVKRIALRALDAIIDKTFDLIAASKSSGSSSGGILQTILGSVASAFGGAIAGGGGGGSQPDFRASGGSVNGGKMYRVNERGEEFFRPSTGGSVVPIRPGTKSQMSGGPSITVSPVFNISTGVQSTVRAEIKSLMPQITAATKQAVVEGVSRGGSFGRRFREA